MSSPAEICNRALSHLGSSKEISNLMTDASSEAAACRRFYEPARDEVLRDFAHPFTTTIAALAEVEQSPNDEWDYSYRYPSDCMMFRKIQSGVRNDRRETRVPMRIGRDATGRLIFTDQANAIGEYTYKETDISKWPIDLQNALSFLLAAYIATRVTGGDPFKLGEAALKKYMMMKTKAENNALNEEQPDSLPDSEFIQDRG